MNESVISDGCLRLRKYKSVSDNIMDRLRSTIADLPRAELLGKMQNESDVLRFCSDYDSEKADCTACRFLIKVHQQSIILSQTLDSRK